jgi:hypothetical protein
VNCYLPYFKHWFICCLLSVVYFCRLCLLKVHVGELPLPSSLVEGLVIGYFFRPCLLKVHMGFSSLPLPPSPASLLHVLFSSLFVIQVFFFAGCGSAWPGSMLVYPRSGCGNTMCHLFAHLLVCISQAGLEPASGGMGVLLFSQCNMV